MQRETDFCIDFKFTPSIEYANQLQSFSDEIIASYTGAFKPPYVDFRGGVTCMRLEKLRRKYE